MHWNKNPALFKKWFGQGTTHDNENVKIRFKRAMDEMFAEHR